jgi:hypothetical protein
MSTKWDKYLAQPEQEQSSEKWDKYLVKEKKPTTPMDAAKAGFRAVMQLPLGGAEVTPYGLATSAWELLGKGEALSELPELQERLPELQKQFPTSNWKAFKDVDEEAYKKATETATGLVPTVSNISKAVEQTTGLPLTPKTDLDQKLRFIGSAGKLSNGSLVEKTSKALNAAAMREGMIATGVPEPVSDILSLGYALTGKTPPVGKTVPGGETVPSSQESIDEFFDGLANYRKELPPPPPPGAGISKSLEGEFEKATTKEPTLPEKIIQETGQPKEPSKPLTGKGTLAETPLKKIPRPEGTPQQTLEDRVGRAFSDNKFYNTEQGGKSVIKEVQALDDAAYTKVNEAYKEIEPEIKSQELNAANTQLMAEELEKDVENIRLIPKKARSSPQQSKLQAVDSILNEITIRDPLTGEPVGYRPMNAQVALDTARSLRSKADFDFAHGDASNIFRTPSKIMSNTVEQSLPKNLLGKYQKAQAEYAKWAEEFNNPYIKPLRDKTNKDFSKTYKGFLELDEYNYLKNILNKSKIGKVYSDVIARDLVDKKLSSFYKNPKGVDLAALDKELRELETFATPEQTKEIRNHFERAKKHITASESQRLKYKSADEMRSQFTSRSKIKEAKAEAERTGQTKLFDKFAEQKVHDMLRKGKVTGKEMTGNDLANIIEERGNYEVLSELVGEEKVIQLIEKARLEGKIRLTGKVMGKVLKLAGFALVGKGLTTSIAKIILNAVI